MNFQFKTMHLKTKTQLKTFLKRAAFILKRKIITRGRYEAKKIQKLN